MRLARAAAGEPEVTGAAACQREVELNRRFAPDVYLGVVQVRDPAGRVCDHLVVMRRLPAARRLSALVQAREPVSAAIRQVARILAAQHASAPRDATISEQGSRDALWRRWKDNIDQIRPLQDSLPGASCVDEVQRLAGRFLAGRTSLFEARIRAGRVVDGHGDLLAEDIFCLDDGPRILDCLEFDDRLRWVDGLDDATFLAMDLERLGASDLAERFTDWYSEYSGDPAPTSLRHHYIAYRAFVRAKVTCLRSHQGDPRAGAEARKLATMALQHLRAGAVTLVLIGGLPGTGKSALAGTLAGLGFTVLNSDRIRKGTGRHRRGKEISRPVWHRNLRPVLDRAHLPGAASPGGGAALPRRVSDRRCLVDLLRPPCRRAGHGRQRGGQHRPAALHGTGRGDRVPDEEQDRQRL